MAINSVTAMINGETYTLTYNSVNQAYEATITAPTQTSGMNNNGVGPGVGANAENKGYYPVSVTVEDNAGNETTVNDQTATIGDSCKLYVLEKVNPVAAFTYPTAGATIINNTPEVAFTFTDSGSGINSGNCNIKIDSGNEVSVTPTGSGTSYTGTYTPDTALSDGSHTIEVYAYDYDGNKSNVASVTFTIDTTPPTLIITSPADDLITNVTSGTLEGTTNDVTSSPVTVTATLNGSDIGLITVAVDGTFSKSITYADGTNTLIVTATDGVGETTVITRTVVLSTTAPEITSITITENPTDAGQSYVITVTVVDHSTV